MEVTGTLQRQAWRDKVLPPIETIRPGVESVPIIFPGNPMRYTLGYLLLSPNECVIMDPGFDSDDGHEQWVRALATHGLTPHDVTGVIATHFHTDHLGMARRMAEESGAWIALGEEERRYITDFTDAQAEEAREIERMALFGVPSERRAEAGTSAENLLAMRALADPDLRFSDGETVAVAGRTLRVSSTPGHTPGHICLWSEEDELVFSGDHVLPRITPNVSLEIRGDADPLRSNLDSLKRVAQNNHFEVAPAHEYRFRGIADRAAALIRHSEERSAEVVEALDAGAETVHEVAQRISWSRGFDSLHGLQFRLALTETAAHLQYVASSGLRPAVPGLPSSGWKG